MSSQNHRPPPHSKYRDVIYGWPLIKYTFLNQNRIDFDLTEGAVNIEYGNIENGNIEFCQESGELNVRLGTSFLG